jgi:endonuclease YncB( thermonuclease family)
MHGVPVGLRVTSLAGAVSMVAAPLLSILSAAVLACGSAAGSPSYPVAWIYDGDTLRLEDGRKVRLIGIDTPELGRDGEADEPYARRARRRLQQLLADGGEQVRMRLGPQQRDRYGRYLAHVYLADGRNPAEQLLLEGLARATILPPNIGHLECLLQAERRARDAGKGLWGQAQVLDARALPESVRGFQVVRGRIERVGNSRRSLWLNLAGGIALRIDRRDLAYFPGLERGDLVGRELEARGWIYRRNGEPRMLVRHGAAIRWLEGG